MDFRVKIIKKGLGTRDKGQVGRSSAVLQFCSSVVGYSVIVPGTLQKFNYCGTCSLAVNPERILVCFQSLVPGP